jgi:hypothetical protein
LKLEAKVYTLGIAPATPIGGEPVRRAPRLLFLDFDNFTAAIGPAL